MLERSALARRLEQRDDPYAELPQTTEHKYLQGQVVPVGFGRVGRRIASALEARGIPYVVAEQNRELVEDLRKQGRPPFQATRPIRRCEEELAKSMTGHVLERFEPQSAGAASGHACRQWPGTATSRG